MNLLDVAMTRDSLSKSAISTVGGRDEREGSFSLLCTCFNVFPLVLLGKSTIRQIVKDIVVKIIATSSFS